MKKLALALLMMISVPAFAEEPSMFDKMDNCTYNALKQTEYAIFASATPDDKKAEFDKFIANEVAKNPSAEPLILFLGEMAWKYRKDDPTHVGFAAYHACIKSIGTST